MCSLVFLTLSLTFITLDNNSSNTQLDIWQIFLVFNWSNACGFFICLLVWFSFSLVFPVCFFFLCTFGTLFWLGKARIHQALEMLPVQSLNYFNSRSFKTQCAWHTLRIQSSFSAFELCALWYENYRALSTAASYGQVFFFNIQVYSCSGTLTGKMREIHLFSFMKFSETVAAALKFYSCQDIF